MKKITKVSLTIAAFFVLLGTILSIIGIAFGGAKLLAEGVRNNDISIRTIGGLPLVFGKNSWEDSWENAWEDSFSDDWWEEHGFNDGEIREYSGNIADVIIADVGEVQHIDAEMGVGTLYIKEAPADSKIRLSGDTEGSVECYVENNELILRGVKNTNQMVQKEGVLYLSIPKGSTFESVTIKAGAGTVNCGALKAQDMEVSVGAGLIECKGLDLQQLSVDVEAGYIKIEDSVVGEVDFDVDVGRIVFEGEVTGNLFAACSIGDLEIGLSGREEEQNYALECDMGTIKIGNRSYDVFSDDGYIDNGASKTYELDCDLGSIAIKFK